MSQFSSCIYVGVARSRYDRVRGSIPDYARPTTDKWLKNKGISILIWKRETDFKPLLNFLYMVSLGFCCSAA